MGKGALSAFIDVLPGRGEGRKDHRFRNVCSARRHLVNRTHLQITEEGRNTLSYFENRISDAIKTDIGEYLKKNELEMRNESSIQSNYYKAVNGEFETELTAVDKDVNLVTIRLTVPTEELAISICENWQKNNREIYQYLTTALF